MTSSVELITVLGSTGSIGVSTLDVISRHPQRYQVYALTAAKRWQELLQQCLQFRPRYAVLADDSVASELSKALTSQGCDTEVLTGEDGLQAVSSAAEVQVVMAGIVGAAGLLPTLAAVNAGKRVLLANKESLVMAGHLFMDAVARSGAQLLPVDSEHNAIFQCLPEGFNSLEAAGIRKILLTGSGGPFRTTELAELEAVTPAQACRHPNWSMGRKISVDSATMMNKGLEFIEARWLFNARPEQIQVVIHPQSIIHSMVEYADGSVLAQLGRPDMRTPIAHALAWPDRIDSGVESLDFMSLAGLEFEQPDYQRFPCLALAIAAASASGSEAVALNAANEIAVAAFLDVQIGFNDIATINEKVMSRCDRSEPNSIEAVIAVDQLARAYAGEYVEQCSKSREVG